MKRYDLDKMTHRAREMVLELQEPYVSAQLTFNLFTQLFCEIAEWFERYDADMVLLAFKPALLECARALDKCERGLIYEYGPHNDYLRGALATIKEAMLGLAPEMGEIMAEGRTLNREVPIADKVKLTPEQEEELRKEEARLEALSLFLPGRKDGSD